MTRTAVAAMRRRSGFCAPSPERYRRRRFRGRKKPARNLEPRRFRLGFADQAGGTVAVDLLELILVNQKIATAGHAAPGAAKRPQYGKDRRSRHQRKNDP